eukprot:1521928-Pyramimonas_sp.AAC.1
MNGPPACGLTTISSTALPQLANSPHWPQHGAGMSAAGHQQGMPSAGVPPAPVAGAAAAGAPPA